MPNVSDRPRTYKKPALEDVDPITNYIPASVRDKFDERQMDRFKKLRKFVEFECLPLDTVYLQESTLFEHESDLETCPVIINLRKKLEAYQLHKMFVPMDQRGYDHSFNDNWEVVSMVEFAMIAFLAGRSVIASYLFHLDDLIDLGTIQVLLRNGCSNHDLWVQVIDELVSNNMKSCLMVSERDVSGSDALNVQTTCKIEGDDLNEEEATMTLNGTKWFIKDAGDSDIWLVLCVTEFDEGNIYRKHTLCLVNRNDLPPNSTRIEPIETNEAIGKFYEVQFKDCKVPLNIIGERGEGYQILQMKSSVTKLFQCLKLCGMGQESLRLSNKRAAERKVFGSKLQKSEYFKFDLAHWRIKIETCKLLCFNAAIKCDYEGVKAAREEIGMVKAVTPKEISSLVDWSIQLHGCYGLCSTQTPLSHMWQVSRSLRINDTPDESLISQLGRLEISNYNKFQKTYDQELTTLAGK
ncbi:uncharacterized protein KLLA0_E15181g [Kluyveromyces lactis]|uniref:KLLA0E15181p n=1 Tax=Kluyveromyces lactis (strain ATCC 8585 / CBS 2359 / DSM 70799 / NBRC 1267 / NRRL Y-1140 / WM37) TaxID=284590 RepID=Q6CN55_KLULA|nr:uncharacterized protein KLLA0_E15181g [Kluyveromyces lactis]CAG99721.1 KLLA0E15181p [Kluyveromyces lactis]|eukprot:XP_454634.1 uncharacterized protein KLLA0_E15181g [Kluyveromyces lactis]